MANLSQQAQTTSIGRIQEFEQRAGVVLPDAYRAFLLRTNGGEPTPDRLLVPGWRGKSTSINRFFGLETGGQYDIERTLRGVGAYAPPGFVPMAEDTGGNLLLLGLNAQYLGKVFFWDHEEPRGDDPLKLREVAGSIDDLLDKLLPE
jgi:hypothetical protein